MSRFSRKTDDFFSRTKSGLEESNLTVSAANRPPALRSTERETGLPKPAQLDAQIEVVALRIVMVINPARHARAPRGQ
jgi:hypothetical protein